MSWLLFVIYTALLILLVRKWSFFDTPKVGRNVLTAILLAKVACSFAFTYIYTYYYANNTSDLFNYLADGKVIHDVAFQHPLDFLSIMTGIGASQPHLMQYYDTCNFWLASIDFGIPHDTHIVIRANAIIHFISMGNVHIHNLLLGFFAFIGQWAICKTIHKYLPHAKMLTVLTVFCLPSVIFWTSTAIKESLLIGFFGLFIYQFDQLICNAKKLPHMLWLVVLSFMLMQSKFYVLMAALPAFASYAWIKKVKHGQPITQFVIAHLFLFALVLIMAKVTSLDFFDIISQKQHAFINMVEEQGNVGSRIDIPLLDGTILSMICNAPQAFLNTLFRPSVFEVSGLTMLMAAAENILLLLLMLMGLSMIKKSNFGRVEVWTWLSFVVILYVLVGLTTPVLGALVRYKIPALPFIGIVIMLLADEKKLGNVEKKIARLQTQ
ncbi:MAG: hypothetical protein MJ069_10805 [Salinivirgaceae bacterium]|nr:hypothetical protein [Salinivirgaceae bacterium]